MRTAPVMNKTDMAMFLYNQAVSLIEKQYLSQAVELLQLAVEYDTTNAMAWNLLGLCLYLEGRLETARNSWLSGVSLEEGGEKAARYLKAMEANHFREYLLRFNRCIGYVNENRFIKALLELLPALETVPNVAGFNLAGLLFYKIGLRREAFVMWQKALQLDLTNKSAIHYLAAGREGRWPVFLERAAGGVLLRAGKYKYKFL